MPGDYTKKPAVVLSSGGPDSAVLLAWASKRFSAVYPLFIRFGLRWEAAESKALGRFLRLAKLPRVKPVVILKSGMTGIYKGHWSADPRLKVPGARAAWDSVYLPGRNFFLLSHAAGYCAAGNIKHILIGSMKGNPFKDATPLFFRQMEGILSAKFGRHFRILAPWRGVDKRRVMRLGESLPLYATLSCLNPKGLKHCGSCGKCSERRWAIP